MDGPSPVPTVRPAFDYEAAFSRTIGWVTPAELQRLRLSRVAIAGLGGVGGAHAVALARLGVGRFTLSDFDHFELPNLNRQTGAGVSSLGRAKIDVISEAIRDINPEAEISVHHDGLGPQDASAFLDGADVFIDGIDFFVLDVRRALFRAARDAGIWALTAAPVGTGVAWVVFDPAGMSFDAYCGFGDDEDENVLRFLIGVAPDALHRASLVDASRFDVATRRGPSTAMGCLLCAGVAATETMKLLLGRPGIRPAPSYAQFDPYSGRAVFKRSWLGGRNPLRNVKVALTRRMLARAARAADPGSQGERATLAERVIDVARWAPSGDNEQPWRFERIDAERFTLEIRPQDPDNPYEFDGGRPVWLAAGGLVAALELAAAREGARLTLTRCAEEHPGARFAAELRADPSVKVDPFAAFVEQRSVDRSAYRFGVLTARQVAALRDALPSGMTLRLLDGLGQRLAAARLNSDATVLRMAAPACHAVHTRVFRFDATRPETGLPIASVPLDPLARALLRWSLATPGRSRLLNRTLAGARLASLETDLWPGIACSAHVVLALDAAPRAGAGIEPWLAAGRAMFRFWLCAERLGLVFQPSFAPIVFAHHARHGTLALDPALSRRASHLRLATERLIGDVDRIVAFGRIGRPRNLLRPTRSARLPLDALTAPRSAGDGHHGTGES